MSAETPPTYARAAHLLTLFACLPIGLTAQRHARQAEMQLAAGDLAGARESSRCARRACWAAALAGVMTWALAFVGVALLAATSQPPH
jgi:hypothetical protein